LPNTKEIPAFDDFVRELSEEFDILLDNRATLHIYVGMLLKLLNNSLNNELNHSLKELDLTISQFNIIMFLAASHKSGREVNQRDIEKHLNVKNPTVTGLLKRLEAKGFIKRYVSDIDGRYKRIELTDKINKINSIFREKFNYNILNTLSDEEELVFAQTLFKINKQFDEKNFLSNSSDMKDIF